MIQVAVVVALTILGGIGQQSAGAVHQTDPIAPGDKRGLGSILPESVTSARFQVRPRFWSREEGHDAKLLDRPSLEVFLQAPSRLRVQPADLPWKREDLNGDPSGATVRFTSVGARLFVSDGHLQFEVPEFGPPRAPSPCAVVLQDLAAKSTMLGLVYPDIIFAKEGLQGWTDEGKDTAVGAPATRYSYAFPDSSVVPNGRSRYLLWLDVRTKLPRRIAFYRAGPEGAFEETDRSDYTNWRLNPKLDARLFDVQAAVKKHPVGVTVPIPAERKSARKTTE